MAVANAWGVPTINPSSSSSHFKRQNTLTFINIPSSRTSSTRNKINLTCCRSSSLDWDWKRWTRHFEDIEQADSFSSLLKFQLEDSVEKEDFEEAAKLKKSIAEATSKDTVAEIMSQLKNAIDEESYHVASRLCKLTGSGLLGWWVGCLKDCNDLFGRIVRITPGVGRFVARSYTPRQLVTASSGTLLFEIFVVKEANETYNMQVVFLQRTDSTLSPSPSPSKSTPSPLVPKSGSSSEDSSSGSEETNADESRVKNSNSKDASNIVGSSEEALKSVVNYFKAKIPGFSDKLMNVNVPKELINENDSMEQLTHDDDEKSSSLENSDDDIRSQDDIQQEGTRLGGGTDTEDEGKDIATKLFIGGILHNKEDAPSKDDYIRSPAEIKELERDSFTLHIPGGNKDIDVGETEVSKVKVASIDAQGVSEFMPLDVAEGFLGVDKLRVSRKVHDIFKLAVSKRNGLSSTTAFSRITISKDDLDPFDGLYVGAFGPLGAEVVQLKRKFGHWHGESDLDKYSDVEFFEYAEATKLTGDLNIPAGQVTFRAKIGKSNRNSNRGKYPDDLGVVASYKGQGRRADIGFQNPRWVDGELLQLSGKGMWPHIGGADLGLLFYTPGHEKSYLVLLNRLKLPE